ncbi:nuclear receptor coactivator 2-like isoform X12 [Venturia canescens]|uniref:nuclear receptor coactivator 2-like isoform X12 n=1 Tax=Venturia canescens TaxID=32260 RepID=UPI001C9C4066|nr:nuclear receptor coactivator 2-like isoform X12 [Venturia canescens]
MSISAAENAGPGPGDLQDPLWVKMSAITGNNTKKRKKSDAKPQSQINKCLNEKRRRTLENTFIDEIEELITATDMSSGKTDKCQILQRAVDKIRHICEQEGSNSHAVQQGEVSSSNPNILSNDQVGPIVLEALDGFLFVVSAEGRIEYVTDNIKQYINYSKDDVFGKDIYNIIHHGDHQAFVESLPMLLGWTCDPQPQTRKGSFNCRFLVKPDDKDETMEQKQQRVSQYETMQICSALLPINTNRLESGDVSSESSDIGPCVMCVARRISSNEKPVGATIEQFSVKSDISGKIIAVDNNGLSTSYSKYLNEDLVGTTIQDLCHPHDLSKLTAHLKGTTQTGEGTSSMYRLRMCSDKFLNVQTKSRLFKGNGMNESDFVMSAYSIVGDNDLTASEGGQLSNNKMCSGHSSNRCASNSNNNNGNNNNNVGGPLMSIGHVNGQVSGLSGGRSGGVGITSSCTTSSSVSVVGGGGCVGSSGGGNGAGTTNSTISFGSVDNSNNSIGSLIPNNQYNQFTSGMDLGFELFPSSTWDLAGSSNAWPTNDNRPESRDSGCGGQTISRPPSQPNVQTPSPQGTYSSSNTAIIPSHRSPMRPYSPSINVNVATHNFSNSFPFSPLQESQSGMSNTSVPIVNANGANPAGAAVLPGSSGPSSVPGPPNPTGNGLPGTSTSASNSIIPGNNIVGPSTSKRHEDNKNSNNSSTPMNIHGNVSHDVNNPTSHSSQACHETQNSVVPTESGRLRNLLTKRTSVSDDNQDTSNNDNDNQNEHRILKILLNQPDEDDYHSEHSNKLRTSPSNLNKSNVEHPKPSLGNNMLLQLLNEKNDEDEDARAGLKKQHELLQQLLKDPDEERKMQEQRESRDDDPLLRSLGFRAATPSPSQSGDHPHPATSQVGQKRPGEDGNMNMAVKRPMDGSHQVSSSGTGASSTVTSKLWEKNKMLASLLAKQPSQPATIPPIPASVISATPQDKLPRVVDRLKQQQPWSGGSMQPIVSNATTTTATSARTPLQNQTRQLPRQATYLNHMLSQQQRPQMGQMDTEFSGSGDYRPAGMDPNSWDNQSSDPDLSDILDQVIEFVPDEAIAASRLTESSAIANLLDAIESPPMNEKMAINAIQKSLMLCETAVNPTSSTITMPGTPPAYSTALGNTSVTTSHNYQPPPMYQQQSRVRFNAQPGIRQNAAQFTQHQQQRAKLLQQQQQQQQQQLKQRLLQQQQQQQLLIPSNATAPDQIASGIHNIDSLLNNTVAPNVSLQRSNVPDSQVSPGYGGSVQMPSGHRLSHSYSHPATLPQHPVVNNNFNSGQQVSAAAARLSPHSPAAMMSFSHPQPLSPRVSQGNYGNSPRMFNVNQTRQQQPAQQQLQQQQRSMPSPGTPASARQSPFPAESFPPPASPTASQFPPVPNPNAANPTAQYRLQRASSTPTATTQLPGGIGSPRHYGGGVNKDQPLLSPSHQHGGCQPTANHNQQNPANSQHYTNQQHTSMLYHTSANSINNHDVQNNQFCYDRTSISMYGTGPGDPQDARSMPPSNTTGHQMGGNTSSTGSMTSEFVRQELRAVVGARTQQRVPNNLQNNLTGQVTQDDLEALGLPFEMSSAGEAVVSDGPAKSWAIGSAGSAPSSSRTTMEEAVRGDPKSSLLQKLLSE